MKYRQIRSMENLKRNAVREIISWINFVAVLLTTMSELSANSFSGLKIFCGWLWLLLWLGDGHGSSNAHTHDNRKNQNFLQENKQFVWKCHLFNDWKSQLTLHILNNCLQQFVMHRNRNFIKGRASMKDYLCYDYVIVLLYCSSAYGDLEFREGTNNSHEYMSIRQQIAFAARHVRMAQN